MTRRLVPAAGSAGLCFVAWANSIEPGEAWEKCRGQDAPGRPLRKLALPHIPHTPLFATCNLAGSLWAGLSSAGRREWSLGASNWTLELIGELD